MLLVPSDLTDTATLSRADASGTDLPDTVRVPLLKDADAFVLAGCAGAE